MTLAMTELLGGARRRSQNRGGRTQRQRSRTQNRGGRKQRSRSQNRGGSNLAVPAGLLLMNQILKGRKASRSRKAAKKSIKRRTSKRR
tara:strand:+ start:352 stop:615 length:264 start_codon:yes stop_codon:yes gene_type:complete